MIRYSASQLAYFSKLYMSFYFDTRSPKNILLIYHSADLYCSRAVASYFVSSFDSKTLPNHWLFMSQSSGLLSMQQAPEQTRIKKGVAEEECTYFQLKEWYHRKTQTFVINQSRIWINFEEQKGARCRMKRTPPPPPQIKKKIVWTSLYDFPRT